MDGSFSVLFALVDDHGASFRSSEIVVDEFALGQIPVFAEQIVEFRVFYFCGQIVNKQFGQRGSLFLCFLDALVFFDALALFESFSEVDGVLSSDRREGRGRPVGVRDSARGEVSGWSPGWSVVSPGGSSVSAVLRSVPWSVVSSIVVGISSFSERKRSGVSSSASA